MFPFLVFCYLKMIPKYVKLIVFYMIHVGLEEYLIIFSMLYFCLGHFDISHLYDAFFLMDVKYSCISSYLSVDHLKVQNHF